MNDIVDMKKRIQIKVGVLVCDMAPKISVCSIAHRMYLRLRLHRKDPSCHLGSVFLKRRLVCHRFPNASERDERQDVSPPSHSVNAIGMAVSHPYHDDAGGGSIIIQHRATPRGYGPILGLAGNCM